MKSKWNWLDTVIVCVVIALVVGVCIFLFRPTGEELSSNTEVDYFITFSTEKAKTGTYDLLKEGDVIYTVDNGKEFGVIDSVEILPNRTAVFNETTKQYSVAENDKYPICCVTVKTVGYKNDSGEVYAKDRAVLYDEEWFLETDQFRFSGTVTGVKGAEEAE